MLLCKFVCNISCLKSYCLIFGHVWSIVGPVTPYLYHTICFMVTSWLICVWWISWRKKTNPKWNQWNLTTQWANETRRFLRSVSENFIPGRWRQRLLNVERPNHATWAAKPCLGKNSLPTTHVAQLCQTSHAFQQAAYAARSKLEPFLAQWTPLASSAEHPAPSPSRTSSDGLEDDRRPTGTCPREWQWFWRRKRPR